MSVLHTVKVALVGHQSRVGGFLKLDCEGEDYVSFRPSRRQRLDHYGNDGNGWDEDGWYEDYAAPLEAELRNILDVREVGDKVWLEVGEKGFIDVQVKP